MAKNLTTSILETRRRAIGSDLEIREKKVRHHVLKLEINVSSISVDGKNSNKAGYTAALVACGWAGAVLEEVTLASGQEPYAQKAQKRRKSNKAGYTANTSRGRVSMGGNARFCTFST